MQEIIESIIQVEGVGEGYRTKAGYEVKTNKQTITILIDDDQNCCENYGYFVTPQDYQEFVGAEILNIATTDTALNKDFLKNNYVDIHSCIFVDVNTNKGTLQFTVYNEHNGYYGHNVVIKSEQFSLEEYL